MNPQIVKGRNPYYDSLKFVLICFVVLAHVCEPARNVNVVSTNLTLYNWINFFHMPVFIFLSGRFSHISDRKRYKKGIIKLLETYVVFQAIWLVCLKLTGVEHFFVDYLTPWYIMWYILALAFWRLLIYLFADRIKENTITWIVISAIIGIVAGFIPVGGVLSFQRTFGFLPFFVAGYCTRSIDISKSISRIPIAVAIIVLVASFLLLIPIESKMPVNYIFNCAYPYSHYSKNAIVFLIRAIFYLTAPCVGIAVMRLIPSNNQLAYWGAQTMFIYIYHAFATRSFYYLFPNGILSSATPWLFLYTIVIMVVLLLLSQSKVLNWLLNPITNSINLVKKDKNG